MLKQRIITALILAPLALLGIFLLPTYGVVIALCAVYLLASREWSRLAGFSDKSHLNSILGLWLALLASGRLLPIESIHLSPSAIPFFGAASLWWLVALGLVLTFPKSALLWRDKPLTKLGFGALTLIPFFWSLMALRGLSPEDHTYGASWVVYVLLLVWFADSGAYFTGKQFGRHKLAPQVSPGKTIEGFIGGILAATLVIIAGTLWAGFDMKQGLYLTLASYLTVFASTLGDLLESMLKREAGMKDSGKLLPGHGGMLDRIDSLTAALPVFVFCYLVWLA